MDFIDRTSVKRQISLQDGIPIIIRRLKHEDEQALSDYFISLSDRTKDLFKPHRFDRETVKEICEDENPGKIRLVALRNNDIIGYFILILGIPPSSKARYNNLDESETCTLAPSVTDKYQNQGLGTEMMHYTLEIARKLGKNKVILLGGVFAKNHSAIHFYKKFGFKTIRTFFKKISLEKSLDMILDI
jgi:GNAT superfamily N-acetyltransferase